MDAKDILEKVINETGNTIYSFAKLLGYKTPQTIYDISNGRIKSISSKLAAKINEIYPNYSILWLQGLEKNIDNIENSNQINQIPMYNLPAAAGEVELYSNPEDVKIIGYLNIPGAHKESIAIPAYGHSMYPTIANGDWAVSRPISDPTEIVWGEVYYIEWSDYKMYKRLLASDNIDEVVLWSDNQFDKIGDRPKYAALPIKKEKIRKLRLVTEILKKPNY